jgi:hypothetical protein
MLVFRRLNYIITTSGIVTLCKQLYSMPVESRLQSSLLSTEMVIEKGYTTMHGQKNIKWERLS